MKKYTCLVLLFLTFFSFSQDGYAQISTMGINYQVQLRNQNGVLLSDTLVTLRFRLYKDQFTGNPVWQEEHNVSTDKYGIASVVIGYGAKTGGTATSFNQVDFGQSNFWISSEIKNNGLFQALGPAEPFQAVPYAKAAGNAQLFPPGFIMPFAGKPDKIPSGWLLCDGSEVSRSQYAALYLVIGDNWGRGNNSSTFNLPDLRGRFLRGVSGTSNEDPEAGARVSKYSGGNIGNEVGSYQGDANQSHTHTGVTNADGWHQHNISNNMRRRGNDTGDCEFNYSNSGGCAATLTTNAGEGAHQHGFTTNPQGSADSRPRNAYVNYLIKY
jgi:microcystin-dependent protein